jgi:hypothetical protein
LNLKVIYKIEEGFLMSRVKFVVVLFSAIFFAAFVAQVTLADPITEFQARQAVSNLLMHDSSHFGENLGEIVGDVRLYRGGQSGDIGYYLVLLEPSGWVIVPADDRFSPIQSFGSGKMTFDSFEGSFWQVITYFGDINNSGNRSSRAFSNSSSSSVDKTSKRNKKKWKKLLIPGVFLPKIKARGTVPSDDLIWVDELLGNEK